MILRARQNISTWDGFAPQTWAIFFRLHWILGNNQSILGKTQNPTLFEALIIPAEVGNNDHILTQVRVTLLIPRKIWVHPYHRILKGGGCSSWGVTEEPSGRLGNLREQKEWLGESPTNQTPCTSEGVTGGFWEKPPLVACQVMTQPWTFYPVVGGHLTSERVT